MTQYDAGVTHRPLAAIKLLCTPWFSSSRLPSQVGVWVRSRSKVSAVCIHAGCGAQATAESLTWLTACIKSPFSPGC